MKKKYKSKEIVSYGLFIALVYIATRFINIPGPTEGSLFHLGNVVLFTIAIIFGKKAGAIAGAFGMALFDVTSSYVIWAPFTFIIRFLMGYIVGYMANIECDKEVKSQLMLGGGLVISMIIMVIGYYVAEAIIFFNIYIPLQSLFGNIMQCIIGVIGAVPLATVLKRALKNRKIFTI